MSPEQLQASRAPRNGGRCPFDLCDGSGFLIDEDTHTASDCECRPTRVSKLRARRLEARIPKRYREISFEQLAGSDLIAFPEQISIVKRFVGRINQNIDKGRGIWIMGDVGTGKTVLAMLASKAALDSGRTTAIYSLPRLLNLIRDSIGDDEGVVGFLDRVAAVDLLHLDDVGAEKAAESAPVENRVDWAMEQLYSIVNSRYQDERSIILTTNVDPTTLSQQIGARTVSRLLEMCGEPLPLFGEDRRPSLAPSLGAD